MKAIGRMVLVVAMALATCATTAAAQSAKSLEFGASGNTIAGPGARTVELGAHETVFLQNEETPLDLCGTVVNVGKSDTVAGIAVVDPGGTNNAAIAAAGEAASVCRKDANVVRVSCNTSTPCQVLWRVDQSR